MPTGSFNESQSRALAMLPKVSGSLSVIFSTLIIFTVVRDRNKRSRTYHRLLVGISLVDISSSFWLGLSTWPIPKSDSVLWSVGNDRTCNLQGFFTQFGITSSFYNASLSVYFLLVIRYGWQDSRIKRLEPWLHALPLLWGFGTSIAGLSVGIFGNANLWCWISPQYNIYHWSFFYGPLWIMVVIVTITCMMIYGYVRKIDRRARKFRFEAHYNRGSSSKLSSSLQPDPISLMQESKQQESNDTPAPTTTAPARSPSFMRNVIGQLSTRSIAREVEENCNRRKEVANQCFWFAGAFYINWVALSLTRLLQTINGKVYFPLLLLAAMTTPRQGLPNTLIYLGPKFRKLRKEWPEAGLWKIFIASMAREQSGLPAVELTTQGPNGGDQLGMSSIERTADESNDGRELP